MGATCFLLVIMALNALKYLVFALLFALSAGKLRFWLFPNLTEDVGFIESFMPVYDFTYTGKSDPKYEDSDDGEDEDDEKSDNEDSDSGAVDKQNEESLENDKDESD